MNTDATTNPLKRILPTTELLPSHPVSSVWFSESVQEWWAAACTFQGRHVEENGVHRVEMVPLEPFAVPIGDGRLVKRSGSEFALIKGSMVLKLVIRQWIEDLPKENSRFAEEIEGSYRWRLLFDLWTGLYQQGHRIQESSVQTQLANDGLPSTPSVVAYTCARFSGIAMQDAPEPRRGGMLTTFFFCSHLGPVDLTRPVSPEYTDLLPDEIVHQATVSANWVRKDFWTVVAKKTVEHAAWITQLQHSLLPKTNHRTVGVRSGANWSLRQEVAEHLADKRAHPLREVRRKEKERREETTGQALSEKEYQDVCETVRKEIEKQKKDPSRAIFPGT